ncbi:hypothetical protein CEXT_308681 [Caerostris extrusa]|uniref:Uncharacterized protein n=1 Tax=Caerostris extrusa TaxID=172846 RepID=A0AAV4XP10_CAEEX|nr:hypothetical protein CEXT_308681 [Caerostris extrusa]
MTLKRKAVFNLFNLSIPRKAENSWSRIYYAKYAHAFSESLKTQSIPNLSLMTLRKVYCSLLPKTNLHSNASKSATFLVPTQRREYSDDEAEFTMRNALPAFSESLKTQSIPKLSLMALRKVYCSLLPKTNLHSNASESTIFSRVSAFSAARLRSLFLSLMEGLNLFPENSLIKLLLVKQLKSMIAACSSQVYRSSCSHKNGTRHVYAGSPFSVSVSRIPAALFVVFLFLFLH